MVSKQKSVQNCDSIGGCRCNCCTSEGSLLSCRESSGDMLIAMGCHENDPNGGGNVPQERKTVVGAFCRFSFTSSTRFLTTRCRTFPTCRNSGWWSYPPPQLLPCICIHIPPRWPIRKRLQKSSWPMACYRNHSVEGFVRNKRSC